MTPCRSFAAMAACSLTSAALGQDALFLSFDGAPAPPPATVRVHLESGRTEAAKAAPWDEAIVRWILVRAEGTQENMDHAPAAPDAAGVVNLRAPAAPPLAGAVAIGLDLVPVIAEIDAEQFRTFLKNRCDEELPPAATGKIRVARVQSCKALARVGDAPASHYAAITETVQTAEIVTHMDPTAAKVGSDVAIVTAIRGEDIEDARVFITCLPTGQTQEIRTAEEGHGLFHIVAPGKYRAEFHHLAKAPEKSGADWTLVSATLTFEVPAQEGQK